MLLEYAKTFAGKRVAFVGLGVSNLPILHLLHDAGASCMVRDKKDLTAVPEFAPLTEQGIRFICGEAYLENTDEDVFFLSPAVRPDLPELQTAVSRGAVLTNEMQEFFSLCPCRIIGVTGSDGKTTTTTLIAKLLEASGHRVHLGGNIGKNLLAQADDIRPEDFAVAELSSFQLMKMTRSPHLAVITNLAPNHLDWHRDMDEYAGAKANILSFQGTDGIAVLNRDDSYAPFYASKANGTVREISGKEALENGIWFDDTGIHRGSELLLPDKDILLVGRHNRYNYAQAICATADFVTDDAIRTVAKTFGGVEHRIEFVKEINGVKYYNSSIDSSPSRTEACLRSFAQKVIVICGGYNKHIPLDPLGSLFREKAKAVVLCGATAPKVEEVLRQAGFTAYTRADNFETAVRTAASIAQAGDVVVLSPAAASFDQFRNFAERGNVFKQLVQNLAGKD